MKYAILARNHGMWGCESVCKHDGVVVTYDTREEAQKVADEYNAPRINNFTSYSVIEWKED